MTPLALAKANRVVGSQTNNPSLPGRLNPVVKCEKNLLRAPIHTFYFTPISGSPLSLCNPMIVIKSWTFDHFDFQRLNHLRRPLSPF
eukprot:1181745-Prorocentrum_minimum.AAC.3